MCQFYPEFASGGFVKRIVTGLLLAAAFPAMAQPAREADWDVLRNPGRRSITAYIPVTTGLMLGVRCVDGAFDAVIAGLPESPQDQRTRPLHIAFGDEPLHRTNWNVTTNRTVAMADFPSAFARSVRRGGPMKIIVPDGAGRGRDLVHDLVLPASSSAIEETMAACNRPLEDPRDALLSDIEAGGLPAGIHWVRIPQPTYPSTNYTRGYAVITCIASADGALSQCETESEQPPKSRFGHAALRAARDARVGGNAGPDELIVPRLLSFRINFATDWNR